MGRSSKRRSTALNHHPPKLSCLTTNHDSHTVTMPNGFLKEEL
jgi:hypothetical protein